MEGTPTLDVRDWKNVYLASPRIATRKAKSEMEKARNGGDRKEDEVKK